MSTQEVKLDRPKSGFMKGRIGALIVNLCLIVVIVVSALWLPPISIGKRLVEGGYTTLGEEIWSIADADGTILTVLPDGLRGQLKAKLYAVPRSDFIAGSSDEDLVAAAAALPTYVDIKSPVYRLALRGEQPSAALLTVPIPNDALPYETLDMYAWTGTSWTWVPSRVIAEEDVILAELDSLPEQFDFVVAQTKLLPPVISADLTGNAVPEEAGGTVVELNPLALMIGDEGRVIGTAKLDLSIDTPYTIIPMLTNWQENEAIRSDLVDNMLVDSTLRQAHIDAIVQAVKENNFQGILLDYRAINPALRGAFTEFVSLLADALHQQGKTLAVRVEYPRQVAYDQWDTGVFNWMALGKAVDALQVPSIPDPQAFVAEGLMDQLFDWAVTQVHRHKLQFILSTRSADRKGNNPKYVTYIEAMKPFANVVVEGGREAVNVGEHVVFLLSTGQGGTGIMYDEGARTYWFRYRDDRNEEHTVWLENAASIAHKLERMAFYNFRGVAFQYLLDDGNDEQVWQVVHEFHTKTIPQMTDQFTVVWTISKDGATVEQLTTSLAEPQLGWATDDTGTYQISAAVSSDLGKTTTVQSETQLKVGEGIVPPEPEPAQPVGESQPEATATPTPEPTAMPEPTATPAPTAAPVSAAQATVNSATLNLRAGPGTNYAKLGAVRQGDVLNVIGKNENGSWIKIAASNGVEAWVSVEFVTLSSPLSGVALAQIPPTPTPAPQSTQSPSQPTQPVQPSGPVPATSSTGFGYGIQVHAPSGSQQVMNMVTGIGFGWIKQQVRWQTTEGSKGQYGFKDLDGLVSQANAAGIKVMFSVVAAPMWARGGKTGDGPPDNYQDFYDFMGAMAAYFKGRVGAYEIWNEQNLKREWEGSPLSAADYVRLLKGAYQAVKAADPNAKVISGAMTPTGISDGQWAIDDRTYLQQMYNAGLKYYCDAVGAHPSGYANPPDVYYKGGDFDPSRGYDDHPSFFFRNTMEDYYNIMAKNGDGNKRVWATEFGWPTNDGMGVPPNAGYEFAANLTEQQQADYIVRAYQWSKSWGHAGTMFLWNLNFWPTVGAGNEMAKYGIVRGDWSPRPAYTALQNMPK
ncbi:MAG: SH3 domain-containing protein [Anaerolineae bacterium]|nr:SH3 domain-containing protein [Anaerolineae bacterium]